MHIRSWWYLRPLPLAYVLLLVVSVVGITPTRQLQAMPSSTIDQAGGTSLYLPIIAGASAPSLPGPLSYVNAYRALAKLPPLVENPSWSSDNVQHAKYMVKNDVIAHSEDPANQWYSPEGQLAAQSSDLFVSSSSDTPDTQAIDTWMQGPFHAIGILDPELLQSGYGSYREADGGFQMGAGLDVLRGLGPIPPAVPFPIMWPGDGATVALRSFDGSESPDPLTSCPGYRTPTGLPILLQIGNGSLAPSVTAHILTRGGVALEHCVFDETSYQNPDAGSQSLGRSVLGERDAIVLIPRSPLLAVTTYTVSITTGGRTFTWSFTTAAS